MDKDKLLNQAKYLLEKVLKYRSPGWHNCPQDEDLLTQEIELYLKQFRPQRNKVITRYKQTDLNDAIKDILGKDPSSFSY